MLYALNANRVVRGNFERIRNNDLNVNGTAFNARFRDLAAILIMESDKTSASHMFMSREGTSIITICIRRSAGINLRGTKNGWFFFFLLRFPRVYKMVFRRKCTFETSESRAGYPREKPNRYFFFYQFYSDAPSTAAALSGDRYITDNTRSFRIYIII